MRETGGHLAGRRIAQSRTGGKVKAVILSAGQGKRLLPLTEELPKCLLPVGPDTTVLGWQLDQLAAAGIEDAVVVTGFQGARVTAELRRPRRGLAVRSLANTLYAEADNLSSVWAARDDMRGEVLLLNGDTLFRAEVVRRLVAAPAAPLRVAISRKAAYDADDMKVRLDGDRLAAVGKNLDAARVDGESIGMMLFREPGTARFRDAAARAFAAESGRRVWYLSVIDALAKEMAIAVAEVPQDAWCEVDYPVDLRHAREAVARWSQRAAGDPAGGAAATS